MKRIFTALFPEKCIVCRKQGTILCKNHRLFRFQLCSMKEDSSIDSVYALSRYTDSRIQKIIKAYKYYGKRSLGPILGQEICSICPKGEWIVIPMPLHWSRLFWRGFNQADLLAQEIAKLPGKVLCRNLKRVKHTKQQARLDKEGRQKNMQDVFVWKGGSLKGKKVLIVDDVMASGATIQAAAYLLKQLEVKRIIGIVLSF